MIKLIAIVGQKGHGKDTVCSMIQNKLHSRIVERFAFGDFLKGEIADACGVSIPYINQQKPLFRPILQWWGTEFRRGQDENYWTNKARRAIIKSIHDLAVITDCRFLNEAAMVRDMGGILVRVVRPAIKDGDQHQSETEQEQILVHHHIINDGDLAHLHEEVVKLLVLYHLL